MIDIQTIMIMSTTQFYCCLTHRLHTSGLKLWVQGQTLRSCFIEMGFATILPKCMKLFLIKHVRKLHRQVAHDLGTGIVDF